MLASALLLGGQSAAAQEARPRGGTLEEIVVTVRRRSEVATDVPMAITVMDSRFLDEQNINAIDNLNEVVPGLNITQGTDGANLPLISLRGQRPSEVLLSMDPAVPLYYADIVLTPVNGSNLALYDIANVQVVKGPQGTLFGRNSTGGAVLITPMTPDAEFGGYLKGTVGDYDLYSIEGAINLPVNDVLSLRIAGQKTVRDGYQSIVDNGIPAGEVGSTAELACDDCLWDEDSQGLRVVASIELGDFRNLTTVSYDENDAIGKGIIATDFNPDAGLGAIYNAIFNGGLAALGGPSATLVDDAIARAKGRDVTDVEASLKSRDEVSNLFFANATEFDIGDSLTIKNIFGYRKVEVLNGPDSDGTALPLTGPNITASPTWPASFGIPGYRDLDGEQFSNELQVFGDAFDDRLEWLAGVYYYTMKGSERFLANNSGPSADFADLTSPLPIPEVEAIYAIGRYGFYNASSIADVENEAYAIFGEGTWSFTDELSLTLGLRQSWDRRELTSKNIATDFFNAAEPPRCVVLDRDGNPVGPSCSRTEDESYSKPTWRMALNYSPDYASLFYGSIATGYRSGGFQTRAKDNISFEPFDEETVLNYEVGHKADWQAGFLGTVRSAVAVYYQDYGDIQKTQGLSTPDGIATVVQNAGKAVIRGIDLDITVAPTDNLVFSLGYAYIDAYYKEWQTPDFDNEDSPFVYIPDHSFFGNARYTLPLDPALGEVSVSGGVYYQSEVDTFQQLQHLDVLVPDPDEAAEARADQELDEYTVWNFRLSWQDIMGSGLDAAAFINNAFDEEYAVGSTPVIDSLGLNMKTYGAPRTFGASLQWNF
ncbi:TonB-dependent receptor [Mangrovimicrobium sediminis]|uniref:TonB-dependent receptor n=1 Tax=Mangrovimicrobium sediminis TaxID=2562682 RepID=UPI001436C127|nr:TonB-dependent receptor [Haliea sp. SAOS-164]